MVGVLLRETLGRDLIYAHKLAGLFLSPLFLLFLLLLVGGWIRSRRLVIGGLISLYVLSTPLFSNWFIGFVERGHEQSVSEIRSGGVGADAIVMLSGMLTVIRDSGGAARYEWGDADRFFAAVELVKVRAAPLLVITNGRLPWDPVKGGEGDVLMMAAVSVGVPQEKVLLTRPVLNTAQEAVAVRDLLPGDTPKVILVTSAFHMDRAMALFHGQGIEVLPFPVDYKARARNLTPMDFLPEAEGLHRTSLATRELLGRLYYRLVDRH